MTSIKIVDLEHVKLSHTDEARVSEYAAILDDLPPITVFDTPAGLLVVDGYHRLAAALRLGRQTIDADVHTGSRTEALQFAVRTASAQGVSEADAMDAVKRHSRNSPR